MTLAPDALDDRYHVEFYGDDIAWLWIDPEDGRLYGMNPESGVRLAKDTIEAGVRGMPVGVDLADMPIYAELARQGIDARDGQQVMLDARQIKDRDKITMLSMAAAVVDGTYQDIVEALKPCVRENEIAALANKRLYEMGSDDVESINAVSGEGCNPHPHNLSDRMIRPGYPAVFDIMHSYNGYRTCHYRTVNPVARRPRSATRSSRLAAGSMPRSRRSSSACPPGRPAVAHRAGDRHGGREDRPRPAVRSWDLRGTNVRSSAGSSSLESPDVSTRAWSWPGRLLPGH
jgi:hypothetical protein